MDFLGLSKSDARSSPGGIKFETLNCSDSQVTAFSDAIDKAKAAIIAARATLNAAQDTLNGSNSRTHGSESLDLVNHWFRNRRGGGTGSVSSTGIDEILNKTRELQMPFYNSDSILRFECKCCEEHPIFGRIPTAYTWRPIYWRAKKERESRNGNPQGFETGKYAPIIFCNQNFDKEKLTETLLHELGHSHGNLRDKGYVRPPTAENPDGYENGYEKGQEVDMNNPHNLLSNSDTYANFIQGATSLFGGN